MKARQSKEAKSIFSNKVKGRAVLREIHKETSKEARGIKSINLGKDNIRVKEL